MSRIREGTHPLALDVVWVTDDGDPNGLSYGNGHELAAESWESATRDVVDGMDWVAEDDQDDDDLCVSMDVPTYAFLVERANRHCAACEGCTRA